MILSQTFLASSALLGRTRLDGCLVSASTWMGALCLHQSRSRAMPPIVPNTGVAELLKYDCNLEVKSLCGFLRHRQGLAIRLVRLLPFLTQQMPSMRRGCLSYSSRKPRIKVSSN